MYKKSLLFFLVLLLSLSTFLAGCSSKKETASSSKDGKTTLVWWSHDGPAFVASNKKLIADYEKLNPNVKIELEIFPYEALTQKLKAAFASKQAPDLAQVFGSWVPEYAKNGLLAEVSGEDTQWVKDNFYEPSYGAYMNGDKLYGIPHEFNLENGGMLAHPEMFEKAGIEYPKTWNELVEAAKKLTVQKGKKIDVKGFDFLSSDNIMFTFVSLILQQGGKHLTEDGHMDFTSPEAINAMTELKKFVTDYKVTDLSNFGSTTDIQDLFFKKKAAMVLRGPWTIGIGKEDYQTEDFDYIPMPSYTGDNVAFAAESGWGEIVAKQSKHQEEAWKFVKYMTQKEQASEFNLNTFSVPANKQVAEDPAFVEKAPKLKASLDVLPSGVFIGHVDTDFLKKSINDQFQLMVSGKVSVEEGLKKAEDAVNKMIDSKK